jgi:hypothetical protein
MVEYILAAQCAFHSRITKYPNRSGVIYCVSATRAKTENWPSRKRPGNAPETAGSANMYYNFAFGFKVSKEFQKMFQVFLEIQYEFGMHTLKTYINGRHGKGL